MEEKVTVRGITGKLVTSRSNGEVVSAAKLADGKHRRETGSFLCEGEKLFEESFLFGRPERVFLRLDGAENLSDRTAERLADPSLEGKIVFLSGPAFDKITTERSPEGIICVSSFPEGYGAISPEGAAAGAAGKRTLLLDSVRDPGNVGTILRSAAAFGVEYAVLFSCADPLSPRALRASMGAVFRIGIAEITDGAKFGRLIREQGRRLVCTTLDDGAGVLGVDPIFPDDCVVIGNEGHGISGEIISEASAFLTIPMTDTCESLNASAAAAVILWEYARLRGGRQIEPDGDKQ